MPPARILCLTTGGSLDKTYDGVTSSFVVGAPTVQSCLQNAQCAHAVEYVEVCRKDSLELKNGDREVLDAAIRAAPQSCIVITHGTDTLALTAKYLQSTALATSKTVVLTGSMKPYAFTDSDGPFNLGAAFAVAPLLPPGCHVVFHGRVSSDPDLLTKDVARDRLVERARRAPEALAGICAVFAAGRRCRYGAKCRDRHCAADAGARPPPATGFRVIARSTD